MKAYLKAAGFAAVLAALPMASASAELVANGGFETGDLTDWTTSGQTGDFDTTTIPVHSGQYAFEATTTDASGTISQVLATTPNQAYSLSFWLANGGPAPNSFEVAVGGTVLKSITDSDPFVSVGQTFDLQQYVFDFVAAGANTTLAFTFDQPGSFWWLDDVSVTETRSTTPSPEPASLALLGAGLAGFGAMRKKRRA